VSHTCTLSPTTAGIYGETCDQIYKNGTPKSGVYKVRPGFRVFCTMGLMDGGWTVIMRMVNGYQDFGSRSYQEYIDGFGNFTDNYFLGLESIHSLTKGKQHELYIGMEYGEGALLDCTFARYQNFKVCDKESGYKMELGTFIWQAPDSSWHSGGDSLTYHNGGTFSAKGSPNEDCGVNNGAWWYNSEKTFDGCHSSLWCNYKRWPTVSFDPIKTFVMAIREY